VLDSSRFLALLAPESNPPEKVFDGLLLFPKVEVFGVMDEGRVEGELDFVDVFGLIEIDGREEGADGATEFGREEGVEGFVDGPELGREDGRDEGVEDVDDLLLEPGRLDGAASKTPQNTKLAARSTETIFRRGCILTPFPKFRVFPAQHSTTKFQIVNPSHK